MAASIGRETTLTVDSAVIAGIQTTGFAGTKEPIDISDNDSSGYRELLAESGNKSLEISMSGVTKSRVLRQSFNGTEALKAVVITYANADTLTGSFFLSSYSESAPFAEAQTFEATLMSAGSWTYVAASP
jgi:TP901-1 family phage major tail protein